VAHEQQVLLPQAAQLVLPATLTATVPVPALVTVNLPVATAAVPADPRVALVLQQQNQQPPGPAPAATMLLQNQLVQLQAAAVVGSPQMQQENFSSNRGGEPTNAGASVAAHIELVRRQLNDAVAAEVYRRAHESNCVESNISGGSNNSANAVLSALISRVISASVPSSTSQKQWQQGLTSAATIPILATTAQPSIAAAAAQQGVAAQLQPEATATIAANLVQPIPAPTAILAAQPAANQVMLRQASPQTLLQILAPPLLTVGLGGGQHVGGSNAHAPQQQLLLSTLTAGGASSTTRLQIQELLRRSGGRPTNEEGKQNEQQDRVSGSPTVGTEEGRSAR